MMESASFSGSEVDCVDDYVRHRWSGHITCQRLGCLAVHDRAEKVGWTRCRKGHLFNTNESAVFDCPTCRPRQRAATFEVPMLDDLHGRVG